MPKYFVDHGIRACAVISGNMPTYGCSSDDVGKSLYIMDRKEAIEKFKSADMKVLRSSILMDQMLLTY